MKTTSLVFACYSRVCAPPPAGRGGSVKGGGKASGATRSAFRNADAVTARKGGNGMIQTKHSGKSWSITVADRNNSVIHRANGRAKTTEGALDRLLKEYQKYA